MKKQHANRKEVKTLLWGYGCLASEGNSIIRSVTICYSYRDEVTLRGRLIKKADEILKSLESSPWFKTQ